MIWENLIELNMLFPYAKKSCIKWDDARYFNKEIYVHVSYGM